MAQGQIDAFIIDVPIAVQLTKQFEGTTVVGQFVTNEQYGILFEEDSPLVDPVNDALQEMKSDGTLERIQDEWFPGSTEFPVIK